MQKLKKILIKTKREIFSEVVGNNPSIFEGEGFDFVELREYSYGDDIRKIDWNVTARMQKPYIKIFKEERELNIVIVSLLSGSVYFGKEILKQELITEIYALLAFSAVKNGDLFSSIIYTDKVEYQTKPTKNIGAVTSHVESIYKFNSLGKSLNMSSFSAQISERIKRRSIIFIIGDFFGEFDFKVLSKRHEVIAIITRDKLEERPPILGETTLIDPETLQELKVEINRDTLNSYIKTVAKRDSALFKHFHKNQIKYTKIYTDQDPFVKLSKLFFKR